jgi:hypothetical protein
LGCSCKAAETGDQEGVQRNEAGAVGPECVRVWEDEFRHLHVKVGDEEFERVRPVQLFPVSEKVDYVSFLDGDGEEVALVRQPGNLDKDSRRALQRALEQMYYVARITRVDSVTEKMGITHWQVMTDRGYAEFEVVHREHIRRLPGGRYLINDVDGNRFEIENVADLDPRSRGLIHSET